MSPKFGDVLRDKSEPGSNRLLFYLGVARKNGGAIVDESGDFIIEKGDRLVMVLEDETYPKFVGFGDAYDAEDDKDMEVVEWQ